MNNKNQHAVIKNLKEALVEKLDVEKDNTYLNVSGNLSCLPKNFKYPPKMTAEKIIDRVISRFPRGEQKRKQNYWNTRLDYKT